MVYGKYIYTYYILLYLTMVYKRTYNKGAPAPPCKSSILVGFSIINHPVGGTPIPGTPHVFSIKASCWDFLRFTGIYLNYSYSWDYCRTHRYEWQILMNRYWCTGGFTIRNGGFCEKIKGSWQYKTYIDMEIHGCVPFAKWSTRTNRVFRIDVDLMEGK